MKSLMERLEEQGLLDKGLSKAKSERRRYEKSPSERPQNKPVPKHPQDTLDLHSMKARDAASALETFLFESKKAGLGKVSVITGRGLHSERIFESTVKDAAERILRSSPYVKSFSYPVTNPGEAIVILK